MNTPILFACLGLALCGAAAAPVAAQQRDVQITMEVLDDVSDLDAVVLVLEPTGKRGAPSSNERIDQGEDYSEDSNLEREAEVDSELDVREDAADNQ